MRRYLVVANQTLGGERLNAEIRDRCSRGPCEFQVVVPATYPTDLAATWTLPIDPAFGIEPIDTAEQIERAREQAEERLERVLADLRDCGADAVGALGDPDPMRAIEEVLEQGQFDEVILSTLPAGISRWLGMDLPSRVERRVDLPVTTVIAQEDG